MATLPESLRRHRDAAGISQEAVGEILGGKKKATISAWERGRAEPSLGDLATLAAYYGVTVDHLVGIADALSEAMSSSYPVPLLTLEQAGSEDIQRHMAEAKEAGRTVPSPIKPGENAYAIHVSGLSMKTADGGISYPPGVFVYCDPDQVEETLSGDRVIARTEEGRAVFRELIDEDGERWLRPLNSSFARSGGEFTVLSRVCGRYIPE